MINPAMAIKGILFDFMGTTAREKQASVINQCFMQAFAECGTTVSAEIISMNRGRDKKEMIESILKYAHQPLNLQEPVLAAFNVQLKKNLDQFSESEGLSTLMQVLKTRQIIVGLGTGFPRDIFEMIFDHLQWSDMGFDYTGIAEEIGKGRPHPDMIFDMLNRYNIKAGEFLKVGDTVADVMEGKNAGVITVALLSGTQPEDALRRADPDFLIHDLSELENIIDQL